MQSDASDLYAYKVSRKVRTKTPRAESLRRYHIHWPNFLPSTKPAFIKIDI